MALQTIMFRPSKRQHCRVVDGAAAGDRGRPQSRVFAAAAYHIDYFSGHISSRPMSWHFPRPTIARRRARPPQHMTRSCACARARLVFNVSLLWTLGGRLARAPLPHHTDGQRTTGRTAGGRRGVSQLGRRTTRSAGGSRACVTRPRSCVCARARISGNLTRRVLRGERPITRSTVVLNGYVVVVVVVKYNTQWNSVPPSGPSDDSPRRRREYRRKRENGQYYYHVVLVIIICISFRTSRKEKIACANLRIANTPAVREQRTVTAVLAPTREDRTSTAIGNHCPPSTETVIISELA